MDESTSLPEKMLERLWKIGSKRLQPGRHQLLAIGLSNGTIHSIGANQYGKTHPTQKKYAELANQPERIYIHAEIDCLNKATKPLDTIVILRKNKHGRFAAANPCPICAKALQGIRHVYHS